MLDLDLGTSSKLCDDTNIYFCGKGDDDGKNLRKSMLPIAVNKNSTKSKASRRKLFNDEENLSPVLGLRILPAEVTNRNATDHVNRAALNHGKEENVLSNYKDANVVKFSSFGCKLCQKSFDDPLQLANHRCVRIENVQYTCSECGKTFNCPANLASHRRWHKPKKNINGATTESCDKLTKDHTAGRSKMDLSVNHRKKISEESHQCGKGFSNPALLKAHIAAFHDQSSICSNDLVSKNVHRPKEDYRNNPITTRREASHSTGAFYQETVFGGLAALAYAAEMHPIMFPFRMNKTDINKRSSTSVPDPKRKAAKLDTHVDTFSSDANAYAAWLPPSPPRSDLSSCSPRSSISDDTEEKCKKATNMRIAAPTPPTDNLINSLADTNSEKQAIVRPMPAAPAVYNEKAFFSFPNISHAFHQNSSRAVTNSSGANINPSNTFLNFHEPYHPFVLSGQQQSRYSAPSLQQWNSWPVHSATAWKTPNYY